VGPWIADKGKLPNFLLPLNDEEVRDHHADVRNGIRTNAVVFGCRRTFLGSLLVFTAAYVTLVSLALVAFVPRPLLGSILLWPCQVAWHFRALRSGLGFDMACWMQRRYRVLFALLGLAMFVTASPMAKVVRHGPRAVSHQAALGKAGGQELE
jgi:1,4-dihydroxy-2-naphthoate octaprenyltransferase